MPRRRPFSPPILQFRHFLFPFFLIYPTAFGWPDGAPCLRTVLESMNPLEAVEHQGGLQLTEPPYRIELDRPCYRAGQPISLTLRGNTTSMEFKGFAIQPLVYDGPRAGKKTGQFVRLDDNGSWQFQCFRVRDSITHSHDEGKARMKLWWRADASTDTIQFVATVVQSLRRFWVKSILSAPLPPCAVQDEFGQWSPPMPTPPPPTDNFKLETFQMFNGGQAQQIAQSLSQVPREGHLSIRPFPHVLPSNGQEQQLASVFFRTRAPPPPVTLATIAPPPPPQQPQFRQQPQQQQPRRFFPQQQQQFPQQQFSQQRFQQVCRDQAPQRQCLQWLPFCPTSSWMQQFCRATCRIC